MGKAKLRDFDPESLLDPAPSSSSDDEQSDLSGDDTNAGREHYLDVGKSKLRKKEVVPLGPEYTGSRISRDAAEDEDSDDPFARGYEEGGSESDDEEEDIMDVAELDGQVSADSEDEELENADGFSDDDEDMETGDALTGEDEVEDVDSDEDSDDEDASGSGSDEEASELRKLMGESKLEGDAAVREMLDTKSLATNLAAAAQTDVAKGNAIRQQRKTFDTLLNTRIRLQKALISTNSMVAQDTEDEAAPETSIEAAETAALTLLNNLTDLRASLDGARTSTKRKRSAFTSTTPSQTIWDSIHLSEASNRKHRKITLEKWSAKTRGVSTGAMKGQLNAGAQQTLTDILDSQLNNSTHLIARTQMPRSCAPLQSASSKPSADQRIYDDADFYGLLLKELLEQRSADMATNGAAEFVVQAPWQVVRDAKTKKVVDTKASKGRRLRYTVHEKLQNFMAPEERGLWGERQRDEMFSSLFGQRIGLGEHDEVESEQEEVAMDAEEQGLMLFRN